MCERFENLWRSRADWRVCQKQNLRIYKYLYYIFRLRHLGQLGHDYINNWFRSVPIINRCRTVKTQKNLILYFTIVSLICCIKTTRMVLWLCCRLSTITKRNIACVFGSYIAVRQNSRQPILLTKYPIMYLGSSVLPAQNISLVFLIYILYNKTLH